MVNIKQYIEESKERFLDELFELLRIPSISSATEHKEDMAKMAELLKTKLLDAGVDKAMLIPTKGNPVVYGEKIIDQAKPTVLVYGHYDVMPVDPIDKWDTDPFEPEIREDKIYGRGADDDKGQSFMHIKAFEILVKSGALKCNVKLMLEGEEEIGSPNLQAFCQQNRQMLQADTILVSDTSMLGKENPSITTGLRGLAYMEVQVTGPDRDLHSGIYGGAVANPAHVLCEMIAKLKDQQNRIAIPGFYDDVLEVTPEEREALNKAPMDLENYKQAINIKEVDGEKGYTTLERTGIRPSLDVNGMWSGYTGEGAKTILPATAGAKISMRLVPNQNHTKISELFRHYFQTIAPETVKLTVNSLHGGQGYVCPIDLPAYKAAAEAMEETLGKKPIPVRSGGSIPIIATFEKVLNIKSILLGFGLESDAIHSPNENFPLEQFFNGIETIVRFYEKLHNSNL